MRVRTMSVAIALWFACSPAGAFAQTNERHAIDTSKSTATFAIAHIFVGRVSGTVPIVSGSVALSGSTIPESVSAVLDATKLHTDEHDRDVALTGTDYFDVQKFPTWSFASTKIVATSATTFAMDGLLTMHGVAEPEHLDVTVTGDTPHPRYHAIGHIDRRVFGMKGARLDPVIGSTADVTLDIAVL